MATLGFPIYISIILCLTVKIRGDFTIITAVSKLKDMVDKLKDSVDSINVRIDNIEQLSNTYNAGNTKKDNVMTEAGDVEQPNERMIKALISEKVFVRKSLSVYEGKFRNFQKKMTEQMNVINSTIKASHDNCERIRADNVANLNSWNKSQANYLNRLEHDVNNATINRETLFIKLQQSIDQVATNTSTKIESVEMKIYESLYNRTEEIWASIAICDPPCENDGVCFRDGLCRCEHMTTGERCQTVLCHGDCTKNGGECVKPGTCGNCPKSRHGENCELAKRCYLTNNQLDLTTTQGRRSSLELVEHSIRVDVNCKSGRHELYSNASQAYVNPFSTRCEYGQFNREVNLLNCVPKRCNTKNLLNMNVYQLNGASVSRMVDSHHKYKLACTDKYEFKGESYLDTPSIERTCENGDFVNVPKCLEKRCSLINTNIRLTLQNSQRPLYKVAHGRQVDVRCKLNRLQLFNPTSRDYLTDFSTECQFGHFDEGVISLTCVPKPCNTRLLAHTKVFNADEIRVEGLLEGGISYKLTCESVQYVFKDYPNDGYIESRCENGSFQNVSSCIEKTDVLYVVRIQVSDTWVAGTDDNIYVRIYGHEVHTETFRMDGDFGRNQLVENEFRGIDVRPIQTVVVSKDSGMMDNLLSILYVSIFIEDSDDYYVFTYRDQPEVWLDAITPVELSISRHPERCIHTYGEAMYRSPIGKNRGSYIGIVSRRECKQRCVTTRSLSCYGVFFKPYTQDRRGFVHCYHTTHSPDSNNFRDNIREETRKQYVSYKRMCREP